MNKAVVIWYEKDNGSRREYDNCKICLSRNYTLVWCSVDQKVFRPRRDIMNRAYHILEAIDMSEEVTYLVVHTDGSGIESAFATLEGAEQYIDCIGGYLI